MRSAFAALCLVLALPASAQSTLYRCQGPDGRLSFQQTPCEAGSQGQQVPAREVPVTTMGDNIRDLVERNASGRGQTTEADMIARLGYPSVTNVDIIEGVETRQHVYRYPDGTTRYVYTRDGVVWGAQLRPGERRADAQPCYSAAQIRDADVSARSIRLSEDERRAAMERVARMRDCSR